MKTVTIYIVEDTTLDNAGKFIQSETHYFLTKGKAKQQFDSCCIRDEMENHGGRKYSVYMATHTVRLPDDHKITTAQQLDEDLFDGETESPDYDSRSQSYRVTENEIVKEL